MSTSQDAAMLTIEQQHAAIIACCSELLAALRADGPIGSVGTIRMRLAGLLQANLACEEAQLIGPIRRLPEAHRPAQFAALTGEAATLRARYSEHVGRWTLAAIGNDREGYARAATDLIRQVQSHLSRKGAVLARWRQAAG